MLNKNWSMLAHMSNRSIEIINKDTEIFQINDLKCERVKVCFVFYLKIKLLGSQLRL